MLSLETKASMLIVGFPTLAFAGAVQKISGVELNTRLIGINFHHASGNGFFDASGETQHRRDSFRGRLSTQLWS